MEKEVGNQTGPHNLCNPGDSMNWESREWVKRLCLLCNKNGMAGLACECVVAVFVEGDVLVCESPRLCGVGTDEDVGIVEVEVGRHLQVARSGSSADATRGVVVGTVAGAEPSVVVSLSVERYATEVSADTDEDEDVGGSAHSLLVGLRVDERGYRHRSRRLNLRSRSVTDEQRLSSPLHRNRLSLRNSRNIQLHVRHSHHIGRSTERGQEGHNQVLTHHRQTSSRRTHHKVTKRLTGNRIRVRLGIDRRELGNIGDLSKVVVSESLRQLRRLCFR